MALQAKLLDERPVIELLDGVRWRKVSPRSSHSLVQLLIGGIIQRCAAGAGIVGTEWDFRLGKVDGSVTLLVPDVAFLRFDRLATIPRADRERPTIAPDIAVEVWSPSNDRDFIDSKIEKYLSCGTTLVLDVDPRERSIVAIDANGRHRFKRGDDIAHENVPWLRFCVDDAFVGIEYFEYPCNDS